MAFERTIQTLDSLREQVKSIIADKSGRWLEESEVQTSLRESLSEVLNDLDPAALPHLHRREFFGTRLGVNEYNLATELSADVIKIIGIEIFHIPAIPIDYRGKYAIAGNPYNCGADSRPPRWYERGDGWIELFNYGSVAVPYPADYAVQVDYIRTPTTSTNRLEFSNAIANLVVMRSIVRCARSIQKLDLAREYEQTYAQRLGAINAEVKREKVK